MRSFRDQVVILQKSTTMLLSKTTFIAWEPVSPQIVQDPNFLRIQSTPITLAPQEPSPPGLEKGTPELLSKTRFIAMGTSEPTDCPIAQ